MVPRVHGLVKHECRAKVTDENTVVGIRVLGDPKGADAPYASVCAVSSNSRCEDRLAVHSFGAGDAGQHYYAVFDGHGGWECAEFAHNLLSASIAACLQEGKGASAEEEMEEAIACGFQKVGREREVGWGREKERRRGRRRRGDGRGHCLRISKGGAGQFVWCFFGLFVYTPGDKHFHVSAQTDAHDNAKSFYERG